MGDFHPDSVVRLVQATLTTHQSATVDEDTGDVLMPARPIQVMLEYEIALPSGAAIRRTVHTSAEHERLRGHVDMQHLLEHLERFAQIHEGLKPPPPPIEPIAASVEGPHFDRERTTAESNLAFQAGIGAALVGPPLVEAALKPKDRRPKRVKSPSAGRS